MQVSLSMTKELLKQVDEAASMLNINRSAYIAIAVQEKIKNDNVARNLPKITELLQEAMFRKANGLDISDIDSNLNQLGLGKNISENEDKK